MTTRGWVELVTVAFAAFGAAYAESGDWRKAAAAAVAAVLLKRADPRTQVPTHQEQTPDLDLPTQPPADNAPAGVPAPQHLAALVAQTEERRG